MINTFKHPVQITGGKESLMISIADFGADPSKADNKVAIQDAINHAAGLSSDKNDVVRVFVPNGLYWTNGTIYNKSNVELVGFGVIKATNNANFDYVNWGGIGLPTSGKTLFAITGTEGNPIKNAGVRGVSFDFNGENQAVAPGESYFGIVISQAEDCWAYDATAENVMYEKIDAVETSDKNHGVCLYIANAKRTRIFGGRYWKAGYDSVRIAGGAVDTKLINVFAGKAKRGAIQITPDSNIVHLTNCTFDNREGGTGSSHAFFGHNMQNVHADGLALFAKDAYCISFFADGNTDRVGQSRHIKLKNVVMNNEDERFISVSGLTDTLWVDDVSIQATALTTRKERKVVEYMPFYFQRCKNLNLDLTIPEMSFTAPLMMGRIHNANIKMNLKTDKSLPRAIGFLGSQEIKNVKIHDTLIDAPNVTVGITSNGAADNIRVIDTKMNTIDSVTFPDTDQNVVLRDCDFRDVRNADKLRLVATESVVVDNVLGV